MIYSFNTIIAEKYGVDESIMVQNLAFWIHKNMCNKRHFYDGRYWTYNSVRAFKELFPFWSEKQIRRILLSLENKNVVVVSVFNKSNYDRTKWYSLEQRILDICLFGQIELPEGENRNDQKVEPIPYSKQDTKQDKNISDVSVINSKKEQRKEIFDYYMTFDNLINHRSYTAAMDKSIVKACKDNNYDIEFCKTLIKRHSEVVELTKDNKNPVRPRPLDKFFGQKVYQSVNLLCSEYEEGGDKYEWHLKNKKDESEVYKPKISVYEPDFGDQENE